MKEDRRFRMPVVGGSSLLVIFSVLCLLTFSLLGLSTVLADQRLTEASVKSTVDYYQADYRAEEIFAQLRNGDIPDGVSADGENYSYTCPISDKLLLQIKLCRKKEGWEVLSWQVKSQAAYEEENITVWDGDPIF